MRSPWIALVVLTTALAGCSDDGGDKADPASLCDGILQGDGTCMPHVEPHVVVEGLPDSFSAYSTVTFTWRLDNGTRGTPSAPVHSMDSRILVDTEPGAVTNATGPDDWGVEVAREQHQNLPGSFEASLTWDEPAMLHLKGYMLIGSENVWTDLGTVDVGPVQPSGNQTTIVIQQGPPPALDSTEASITVGDAIAFQNDSPVDYTAVFECSNGVTVPETAVGMQASSQAIVFLEPTRCEYTLQSALGATGEDPAELSGRINVNTP